MGFDRKLISDRNSKSPRVYKHCMSGQVLHSGCFNLFSQEISVNSFLIDVVNPADEKNIHNSHPQVLSEVIKVQFMCFI